MDKRELDELRYNIDGIKETLHSIDSSLLVISWVVMIAGLVGAIQIVRSFF